MSLPISVVVAHRPDRAEWFRRFCLPSVDANDPMEILVESVGTAPQNRNRGLARAKQPYVFFCDDDVWLPDGHLGALLAALEEQGAYMYAYTDYYTVRPTGIHRCAAAPYDHDSIQVFNYISTMSLVLRAAAPLWDEALGALQNWDYWLSTHGKGLYIPNRWFMTWDLGDGTISSDGAAWEHAQEYIRHKHGLEDTWRGTV